MTAKPKKLLLHPGTPVRVYRNLRTGVPPWSIQAMCRVPKTANTHHWYVVAHADALLLEQAHFKVYEAGRRHALKTGHGYIHAYVLGTFVAADSDLPIMLPDWVPTEVAYDPHKWGHFFDIEVPGVPVVSAARVWLTSLGDIYAEGASE